MDVKNIENLRGSLEQMRDKRSKVIDEMTEIDLWLGTVGKTLTHKADKKIKVDMTRRKVELQKQLPNLDSQIRIVNREIEERVIARKEQVGVFEIGGRVKVTDHALVRWIERKHGLNVEQMKADMYTDMMRASMVVANATIRRANNDCCLVDADDGMSYVVDPKNGVIVTCYQTNEPREAVHELKHDREKELEDA